MSGRNSDVAYDSFAAFYADNYGHALREVRPAGRTSALLLHVEQQAGDWSDAATPDLVIQTLVGGTPIGSCDLGAGRFSRVFRSGMGIVQAPNAATDITVDSYHALNMLSVPYRALMELAGEDAGLPSDGDFGRLHSAAYENHGLTSDLRRLWCETAAGSPHGALYADGMLLQIVSRLLALRDGSPRPAPTGLAGWQLKRVQQALEDQIESDTGLSPLAALIGVSETHLCRAFKASTGLPPYRWLAERRIERAKLLLADPRLSIMEVAQAVGYSGQNTFGEAFRRVVGVTPGRFRKLLRD